MTVAPPALLSALFDTPLGAALLRQNVLLLAPELILLLTAVLLLLLAVSRRDSLRREIWPTALIGALGAFLAMTALFTLTHVSPATGTLHVDPVNIPVLNDQLRVDLMGSLLRWAMVLALVLVLLMSRRYLTRCIEAPGECLMLLFCATLGASLLTMAHDLVTFFIALETLGISSFLLAGFLRQDTRSTEAALKFLLYGGGASACLLYGFSLLYGLSGGHTDFTGIIQAVSQPVASATHAPRLLLALGPAMGALILAGLLFKLSAAPFHQWTPDVYEGAPTPVTAFLSVVSKIAAFAAAIRVLALILAPMPVFQAGAHAPLFGALALMAMASMTLGNVAALRQQSLKRLLAYSTIAHVGYLLLGLALAAAGVPVALPAVLYYLLTYVFMNLGAFAAVIRIENEMGSDAIADVAGLARKKPWLVGAFSVFLLSLAGIPITAGFFAKFFLFQALATSGGAAFWLILFALLTSTIALYYYLNVVRVMVVAEPSAAVARVSRGMRQPASAFGMALALGVCLLGTLALGLWADPALRLTQQAVAQLGKHDPFARVFLLSRQSQPLRSQP